MIFGLVRVGLDIKNLHEGGEGVPGRPSSFFCRFFLSFAGLD